MDHDGLKLCCKKKKEEGIIYSNWMDQSVEMLMKVLCPYLPILLKNIKLNINGKIVNNRINK